MASGLDDDEIEEIRDTYREKGTIAATASELDFSETTVRKYTKELREQQQAEREEGEPPKPDHYGIKTEEDAKKDAEDIFEEIIAMQKSWGRNAPAEVGEYLIDMAEYHGAPSPQTLREWIDDIEGISDKAVTRVPKNYKTALLKAVNEGKLDKKDVPTSSAIAPSFQKESSTSTSDFSIAEDLQMMPGDDDDDPFGGGDGGGGSPDPMEMMMMQAMGGGGSGSSDDMMKQMAMQAMQGEQSSDSQMMPIVLMLLDKMDDDDDGGSEVNEALLNQMQAMQKEIRQLAQEQNQSGGSQSTDMVDELKKMKEMRDTAAELADSGDDDAHQLAGIIEREMAQLRQELNGSQQRSQPESSGMEGLLMNIAQREDVDTDTILALAQQVGGVATDPEIRKLELEREMEEEKYQNRREMLDKLLESAEDTVGPLATVMASSGEGDDEQGTAGEQAVADEQEPAVESGESSDEVAESERRSGARARFEESMGSSETESEVEPQSEQEPQAVTAEGAPDTPEADAGEEVATLDVRDGVNPGDDDETMADGGETEQFRSDGDTFEMGVR